MIHNGQFAIGAQVKSRLGGTYAVINAQAESCVGAKLGAAPLPNRGILPVFLMDIIT